MFVREKTINGYTYLYLVESVREGRRTRQRIVKNLGRKEAVLAAGGLERLAASMSRFVASVEVRARLAVGRLAEDRLRALAARRIGAPLLFGRLWEETGCRAVLEELLGRRRFAFPVERAIFTAVLHRLMVSGSDRACESWLEDYEIPGTEGLALHHFYRTMAWLGEELPPERQGHATPFAPRTVKDEIEEALFERRRDLFTDLSVVFMDTTSLAFEGAGGCDLGRRGHSKDKRPDLNQMIVGVVIDGEGRPICSEMWPGNTADVAVLVPVIDRLRHRFGIGRVCVVADRGMISSATIAALEDRGLDYVLGVRERSDKLVRELGLEDEKPFTPLLIDRQSGETQLFVKEVKVATPDGGRRYIVARNEAEAEKDRTDRQAIVEALDRQLKKGDKTLIGNSAYRRFLRKSRKVEGESAPVFEIDPGKLAEEARYDGIFVLRTNARITPLMAVLRYRDLLQVEELFRTAKALMHTRPIYHSTDEAIRGHVFCSFLALILRKELQARCEQAGIKPEWAEMLRNLDRLQDITIDQDGQQVVLRTPAPGGTAAVFKAVGMALPRHIKTAA